MPDTQSLVPADKGDLATTERALAADPHLLVPVIPELIEWLRDGNWPVAVPVAKAIRRTGTSWLRAAESVLSGDDDAWKYWVLLLLVKSSPECARVLEPVLRRAATQPTLGEREEGVDAVARDILTSLGAKPA